MHLRNTALVVAALACATLGTGASAGQDSKVMAGSSCQIVDRTPIPAKQLLAAFEGGRITNLTETGKDLWVICPLVRDNIKNTNGTVAVTARVDGAFGEDVYCTLTSRDRFAKFVREDYGFAGKDGPASMTLDVDASVASGTYELKCALPPYGAVLSYQLTEFTPTEELLP